jgi:hypothetical protein
VKCVVHIGTEKTGTKSIQEFLHINRDALIRHGYAFAQSAGLRNDERLALAAYNPDRTDFLRKQKGLATVQRLEQHRHELFAELQTELREIGSGHTVLFSSELIQSRLRNSEELQRLKALLNALGFTDIQVLVYLRRPVEIATSLYSTAVTNGITEGPPPPDDEYFGNICDHRKTLLRFRAVFGDAAVVPRIHEQGAFVGGTLLTDFMDSIGLADTGGELQYPAPQNPSLPRLAIELLRRINRDVPMLDENDRPNRVRIGLVKMVRNAFESGPRYALSPELRQAYENAFRDGNEWVRKEYFPGREQLFMPVPEPEHEPSAIEGEEFDAIARFVSDVWLYNTKSLLAITDSRSFRIAERLNKLKSRLWH